MDAILLMSINAYKCLFNVSSYLLMLYRVYIHIYVSINLLVIRKDIDFLFIKIISILMVLDTHFSLYFFFFLRKGRHVVYFKLKFLKIFFKVSLSVFTL